MEGKVVVVKMAEIGVVEDSKLLKTTLGSCVGVILHDRKKYLSGMAHIMLPQKLGDDTMVGKYADTAIPALLSRLLRRGSNRENIRAYLAGGANMFEFSGDMKIATVGEKNIVATKRILGELNIPIAYEETGGRQGRTVLFDNHNGEIHVKTLDNAIWKGDRA